MRRLKPIMTYLNEKEAHGVIERARMKKISVSEFVRKILTKENQGDYYNDERGILRERK